VRAVVLAQEKVVMRQMELVALAAEEMSVLLEPQILAVVVVQVYTTTLVLAALVVRVL
jgi:hypothetical protein